MRITCNAFFMSRAKELSWTKRTFVRGESRSMPETMCLNSENQITRSTDGRCFLLLTFEKGKLNYK